MMGNIFSKQQTTTTRRDSLTIGNLHIIRNILNINLGNCKTILIYCPPGILLMIDDGCESSRVKMSNVFSSMLKSAVHLENSEVKRSEREVKI